MEEAAGAVIAVKKKKKGGGGRQAKLTASGSLAKTNSMASTKPSAFAEPILPNIPAFCAEKVKKPGRSTKKLDPSQKKMDDFAAPTTDRESNLDKKEPDQMKDMEEEEPVSLEERLKRKGIVSPIQKQRKPTTGRPVKKAAPVDLISSDDDDDDLATHSPYSPPSPRREQRPRLLIKKVAVNKEQDEDDDDDIDIPDDDSSDDDFRPAPNQKKTKQADKVAAPTKSKQTDQPDKTAAAPAKKPSIPAATKPKAGTKRAATKADAEPSKKRAAKGSGTAGQSNSSSARGVKGTQKTLAQVTKKPPSSTATAVSGWGCFSLTHSLTHSLTIGS